MSDLRVLAVTLSFPPACGNGRLSGWRAYKASLACLALVLGQGCQADPASLPVEPPPSRLATRVDRLLDDPTQLPAVALAVAATTTVAAAAGADSGTLAAPDAGTADGAESAPDTSSTETAVAEPADAAGDAPAATPQAAPAPDPKATAGAKPAAAVKPSAEAKPQIEAKPAADKSAASDRKAEAERKAETERKAEAERAAKAAAAEPPPPPGADATDLYYSGKRKLDAGDLRGAVADFKASQAVRFSVRTLTMLGRAYFDLGEFGPAAKALQQAGDHDDAMLLLAQLYQQQGKTAQARKVYERFLKVHGDHAKAAWVKRMLDAL